MLSDDELRQIETFAEKLIQRKSFNDTPNEDEAKDLLKSEIALVNEFKKAIKEKDYAIFDIEPVREALKKSRSDIWQYTAQFEKLIEKKKDTIEKYENQIALIHNHNQNVTYNTYDLRQERAKLGFFDGARKKEIDAELAKWERMDEPPELRENIDKLEKEIKQIQETFIDPYRDIVKGINFYEGEAEAHRATEQRQRKQERSYQKKPAAEPKKSLRENLKEKQELVKASQEPREAPKEAPAIKGLKEVHKPNLKPLKRL